MTTTKTTSIPFASLPAKGDDLLGGIFAGVITQQDGTHCAVVLLPNQPATKLNWQAAMDWAASQDAMLPNQPATKLNWQAAMDWAASQDAMLPTRPVAALLFANLKPLLAPRWHWTSDTDEDDASYAWYCHFYYGFQGSNLKSYEGSAVAVRCIPVTA